MPMFTFTLKKYLRSKSTWIISVISAFLIAFLIGAVALFGLMDKKTNSFEYASRVTTYVGLITGFLSIFSAIFAGFKAAQMYKDEVEEGTFLMVLSKPVRRSSIIFQKWLALIVILLVYAFINAFFYMIGILLADKGGRSITMGQGVESLRSHIVAVSFFIFLILFVVGMIFASIGLLISTKLSVSSTIGISIGLGLIIPITSIFSAFMKKDEYKTFTNAQFPLLSASAKMLPGNTNATALLNQLNEVQKTIDAAHIYDWAGETGESDGMKFGWVLNLQYQINNLSALASDRTVTETAKQLAKAYDSNPSNNNKYSKSSVEEIDATFNNIKDVLDSFDAVDPTIQLSVRDQVAMMGIAPIINMLTEVDENNAAKGDEKISSMQEYANKIQKDPEYNALKKDFKTVEDFVNEINSNATHEVKLSTIVNMAKELFTFSTYHFKDVVDENNQTLSVENILYDYLFSDEGILSSAALESTNFAEKYDTFKNTISNIESPLSGLLLDQDAFASFTKDFSNDQKHYYSDWANTSAGATTNADRFEALHLSKNDHVLLKNILLTAGASKLAVVEAKPYVKPGTLLVIYFIIALALVPLTFLVMRRQDFR